MVDPSVSIYAKLSLPKVTEATEKFLDHLAESLKNGTFVKMTLGNYKGADEHLQRVNARLIETKKGARFFVLYRYDTRDTAKNFDLDEAREVVAPLLGDEFRSAHLFTTANDLQLEIGRKGKSRLNLAKPTTKDKPPLSHDRQKSRHIDPQAFYLNALGITTENGLVREKQQDKWRQINKFVEILDSLVNKSQLRDRKELKLVDMGSGKGYLTFAAYDYFNNIRGIKASITGVEARRDLATISNDIADASGFTGLRFVEGTISSYQVDSVDILIALHACNTATDDALFKGVKAKAELLIVVPCCHHELRSQMKAPQMLKDVLKHGVMLERVAETMTDGMRSLLLERSGYSTKLFEFVSIEHTPKNNMLVGTRLQKPSDPAVFDQELREIKDFYGISHQHLETLILEDKDNDA